jgi:4-hydroxybenzoate polyprenyltransferase
LISIPLGVLFVVCALGNWHWGPLRHTGVFVGVVLVIATVCALINRYYNEHYGRVTPSTGQQLKVAAAVATGVALMIGGALLLRSRASWSLDLPVNAIAATFALLMLVYYAIVVGVRAHHLIIWGSLLVAGLLPVWNGADPSNVGLVLAGAAVIVNGVFDHRLLVHSLGRQATPTPRPRNAGG